MVSERKPSLYRYVFSFKVEDTSVGYVNESVADFFAESLTEANNMANRYSEALMIGVHVVGESMMKVRPIKPDPKMTVKLEKIEKNS